MTQFNLTLFNTGFQCCSLFVTLSWCPLWLKNLTLVAPQIGNKEKERHLVVQCVALFADVPPWIRIPLLVCLIVAWMQALQLVVLTFTLQVRRHTARRHMQPHSR